MAFDRLNENKDIFVLSPKDLKFISGKWIFWSFLEV